MISARSTSTRSRHAAGRLRPRRDCDRLPASPRANRSRLFACVAFFFCVALALPNLARAHDPFESWTAATLRPDVLDLNVVMAQSTAVRLIDPKSLLTLNDENFAEHKATFVKAAPELYIVTAGRTPLAPKTIDVELTEEGDVAFKIVYPKPAPGRLHFHAAFLKKLGEGFGGMIEANFASGESLGWDQISWENPNLEVTVPATAPTPAAKKK
ncbi:MAG TPA: hypothetical protein VHD62_19400 [Opitutaceae bacterium]|nr:hypothetical protein [Opitutaceae bacterium]